MRSRNIITILSLLVLLVAPFFSSGQIPNQIVNGLKSGDAKTVASYFNDNIELIILDRQNVCSQAQGEQILKDFFARSKPTNFQITHQGGQESVYAIGKMTTSGGNYRVYFLLKPKGNTPQIVQLRIDKD